MQAATSSALRGVDDCENLGFVLLDSTSRIVCANDEAVRILVYTHRDEISHGLSISPEVTPKGRGRAQADSQQAFEEKIRQPLLTMALASPPNPTGFTFQLKSGRRAYFCRMFTMTSAPNSTRSAAQTLFVLQRGVFPAISRLFDQFLLTLREREVVGLLLEGRCNKEIAVRMGISVFTVKAFLRSITMKMEVSGRSEIVAKILARALPPPVRSAPGFETQVLHPANPRSDNLSSALLMSALSSAKNRAHSQPLHGGLRLSTK